ncbi:MAG: hypothetical protein K1Y36_01475 [Blastocatellia bacterium]|nr:hypothetical protein [Blastocatellia bacterium]
MFSNPEFVRNVRLQHNLMLGGTVILVVVLALVEMLLWMSVYSNIVPPWEIWSKFGQTSFYVLLFGEFILFFCAAAGAIGSSFAKERVAGTLLFQQMTLLSPHEMILGKLLGAAAPCYLWTAMLLPFSLLAAGLANLDWWFVGQSYLILLVGGVAFQMLAMRASIGAAADAAYANPAKIRRLEGVGPALGVASGVLLFPAFGIFGEALFHNLPISFWGMSLPGIVVIVMLGLFIGGWSYGGAVRSYQKLQNKYLSPVPTWFFLGSVNFMAIGFLWNPDTGQTGHLGYFYQAAAARLTAIIAVNFFLVLGPLAETLMTRERLREWFSPVNDHYSAFRRQSIINAFKSLLVAIGTAVVSLGLVWINLKNQFLGITIFKPHSDFTDWYSGFSFLGWLTLTAAWLLSVAAMVGFTQYWSLTRPKANPFSGIGIWIGFLFLMVVIGVKAGFDSMIWLNTPISMIVGVLLKPEHAVGLSLKALLVELLLAIVSIALSYWQWKKNRDAVLAQEQTEAQNQQA